MTILLYYWWVVHKRDRQILIIYMMVLVSSNAYQSLERCDFWARLPTQMSSYFVQLDFESWVGIFMFMLNE